MSTIIKAPAAGGASGHVIVDSGSVTANAGTNLNTSLLATEATLDARTGALTETAPGTDTASSGLNGRLQRIAQRLTSLIALLPSSLGQKAMAASLAVTVASDQAAFPVTANAGTNLNTSALALSATQTDGTQKAITRGGAKGTTTAADITSTASGANHNAGDAILYDAAGNVLIGQKTMTGSIPVALASDQAAIPVTPPTLTKGTQGATGFSVQELKDAGRVNIMWTAEFSPAATAEALLTVTESRDGAATTTFTSKVVTNGKRLRITSITFSVENTLGTSLQRSYLRLRFNAAGAVTTASPQQHVLAAQAIGTVKSISPIAFEDFPDGVEYLGDGTKQIGFTIAAPDWVTGTSTLKIYMAAFGYEY